MPTALNPLESSRNPTRAEFQSTIWSDILAAGDPAHPRMREHLDVLCRRYWKPVFSYVRLAWRASEEDARDLTQGFFTRLLEKDFWSRLRPDRGSFRGYLKKALKHFLINAREYDNVRRPTGALLPINEEAVGPADAETPDQAYDREWFACIMEAATGGLRKFLEAQDKKVYFEVFSLYYADGGQGTEPRQNEVAQKLGIKKSDVNNYLAFCRRELLRIVREHIRDYVADEKEVEEELRQAGVR